MILNGFTYWIISYKSKIDDTESTWTVVTPEYREYAEKICDLLDTFENCGIGKYKANGYWSTIFATPLRAYYTPNIELCTDALILQKKSSSGTIISVIGFDIKDKGMISYDHDKFVQ